MITPRDPSSPSKVHARPSQNSARVKATSLPDERNIVRSRGNEDPAVY